MRIGIDLGGTKIECIALEDDGTVLLRKRIDTPRQGYRAVIEAIVALIRSAEKTLHRIATVGIGTPGAVSPATGMMKNSNSEFLNGQPFDRDIENALKRPVRIANDVNCFALSEATDGAASGAEVVFGVIIGTGTGGGVVVGGRVLTGLNAIAGEWGHNPLPWPTPQELPGPACYCGKRGCVETFCSGPGFARDYADGGQPILPAPAIAALAENGDEAALKAIARYEERLAKSLASVINVLDPEVIVLGGGMSKIERLYTSVPKLWGRYVFSDALTTRLLPAKHGDASGVRGAAWLWSVGTALSSL
ncbi:MAG: ROK family protein [Chromatiales bacterium]